MPTRGGAAGGPPLDERPAFAEFAHVREGELDDADASVGNVLEETLYGKTGETLGTHALNVDSEAKPPWGQVSGSVDFSHYLSQPESYRIESFGMIDIRLKKGLSFNIGGGGSWIRAQIYLPKGEASTEEVASPYGR